MTYRQDPRPSASDLKSYWISPKAGDNQKANPLKQTPDMALGTLVHDIVLLGESALEKYRTDAPVNEKTGEPFGDTSKKYAEWKATIEADGYTAANPATIEKARKMAASITPKARSIIKACDHVEEHIYWEQDGVPMKGTPDAWKTGDYLVEIKTTRQPFNSRALQTETMRRLYDLQCSAYRSGIGGLTRTVIIWISEANGCDCAVTWLSEKWLEHGNAQLSRAIENYKQRGLGIGQAREPFTLELPPYAVATDDLELELEDENE